MDNKKISGFPAGRELDALVAVYVCGWVVDDMTATSPTGSRNSRTAHGDDDWLPYYSADMGAAWQVVEKISQSWFVSISVSPSMAACHLQKFGTVRVDYAETAALAICRAALLAVIGGV